MERRKGKAAAEEETRTLWNPPAIPVLTSVLTPSVFVREEPQALPVVNVVVAGMHDGTSTSRVTAHGLLGYDLDVFDPPTFPDRAIQYDSTPMTLTINSFIAWHAEVRLELRKRQDDAFIRSVYRVDRFIEKRLLARWIREVKQYILDKHCGLSNGRWYDFEIQVDVSDPGWTRPPQTWLFLPEWSDHATDRVVTGNQGVWRRQLLTEQRTRQAIILAPITWNTNAKGEPDVTDITLVHLRYMRPLDAPDNFMGRVLAVLQPRCVDGYDAEYISMEHDLCERGPEGYPQVGLGFHKLSCNERLQELLDQQILKARTV